MNRNSKLAEWMGIDIDEINALYKMYGGITPLHLQKVLKDRTQGSKTIEFGAGLAAVAFAARKTDHVVVTNDRSSESILQHYCPAAKVHLAPFVDGWYDWRPATGELYDVIYIHHNKDSTPEQIVQKIPECVAPYAHIYVDNIPEESHYNWYEDLAERLDYNIRPNILNDRMLVTLRPLGVILGSGPGAELIKIFDSLGMAKCQLCIALANRMNRWGIDGCLEKIDEIIEDIFPRAKKWWETSKPWMKAEAWWKSEQGLLSKLATASSIVGGVDNLIRESIAMHVHHAIDNAILNGDVRVFDYGRPQPIARPDIDVVYNDSHEAVRDLSNVYDGSSAFLLCGGPSLAQQDLSLIPPNAVVAAVNQVATIVRPHVWFSTDAPDRFHPMIWEDPAIMKFTAESQIEKPYRVFEDGVWKEQSRTLRQTPNTFFVDCVDNWDGNYLASPASWSTPSGTKSVLMVALRTLYWLGINQVYLLGCDFRMSYKSCYAFDEYNNPLSRSRNNSKFAQLNKTLRELFKTFERYNFRVYNCTPGGCLHSLPRLSYADAISACKLFG